MSKSAGQRYSVDSSPEVEANLKPLDPKYEVWIRRCHAALEDPSASLLGKCKETALALQSAFPELELIKGHVYCPAPWGKRGHWWCKTTDGVIIDPTAVQFPLIYSYEEYIEGMEVQLGTCLDCGAEIWGDPHTFEGCTDFCGAECADSYIAYLNSI